MPHDQFLDPPLPDVIAQWTRYVEALDPRPGDRVLDVGCGSGDPDVLLLRLRPEVGAVVGLDPSGARLANARRHTASERSPVFVRGDGRRLPFPEGAFDRVISADTLEWVRPPLEAVQEMRRVLRPGGRAVLTHTDFDSQLFGGVDARLSREIVHAFNDAGPNGTIARELPSLAREAGFGSVEVQVYTLVNGELAPGRYVWEIVETMRQWFASKPVVAPERFERWVAEIEAAAAARRFFYAVNRVICVCG